MSIFGWHKLKHTNTLDFLDNCFHRLKNTVKAPGGQGYLGGQGGPGDQVCQCIWFTWSKQSNYQENLRCHACDTLTDTHGKVVQYSV